NIPLRPIGTGEAEPEPFDDSELPALSISLLPILLPVVLISANTIVKVFARNSAEGSSLRHFADVVAVLGNVNLAMLLATAIAMWMLKTKRRLTLSELSKVVEVSLMSGGIVILITAAGGAFGAMLKAAEVGPALGSLFTNDGTEAGGLMLLILGAVIASVMKIAQGSGTVAMITASSMIAAMIPSMKSLGYHPAYLATAIGGGSMICSWMNDSGFWIFVKMTGLSEAEGLKSWTLLLAVMGLTAIIVSLILAIVLPLGWS
ncbi:MAG TPA: gluconate permease, partial [Phycisphaerales bacterium]|nr:gluconate permease [Phycisphaerales bacterium]